MKKNIFSLLFYLAASVCFIMVIQTALCNVTPAAAAESSEEDQGVEEGDFSIPIFDDVFREDWAAVKRRLEAGEEHVNVSDLDGMTLLHYAVMQGNNDAILMLLKAGADKERRLVGDGPTPYEMAKDDRRIRPEILERLRTKEPGSKPEQGEDMIYSALRAAKEKDWQTVRFALIGIPGEKLATVDKEGRTLLHYAAMHGTLKDISQLIDKGADRSILDGKDCQGKTPYDYSLKNSNLNNSYVKALMGKKTKLQYDLLEAIRLHGDDPEVIKRLLSDGANPNDSVPLHPYNGYSPFLMAVKYGQQLIIPTLLEHGADINTQAPDGVTYPMMAVSGPHALRHDLLYKCKTLESEDNQGRNLLYYAIFTPNNLDNLIWITSFIKDINHQDKEGNTAIVTACLWKKTRAAGMLYLLGADPSIRNKEGKNCYDILGQERFQASVTNATQWLKNKGIPADRAGMLKHYFENIAAREQ